MEKLCALDLCTGSAQVRRHNFQLSDYPGGLVSSRYISCHYRRISRPYVALFRRSKLLTRFTVFATVDGAAEELPAEEPDVPLITTKFVLERKCKFGEAFVVTGEDPLLGAWDLSSAVPMEWSEGHVWTCQVDLPVGKHYEYKFVLTSKEGEPQWQPGPNRSLETSNSSSPLIVSECWDYAEQVKATTKEEALQTEHHAGEEEQEDTDNTSEDEPEGDLLSSTVNTIKDAFVGAVKDVTEEEDELLKKDSKDSSSSEEELESSAVSIEGKDDDKENIREDPRGFKSFKFGEEQPARDLKNGQPVSTKSESPEIPFLETAFTSTVLGGGDENGSKES